MLTPDKHMNRKDAKERKKERKEDTMVAVIGAGTMDVTAHLLSETIFARWWPLVDH